MTCIIVQICGFVKMTIADLIANVQTQHHKNYDVRYVNGISPTIKADGGISIHFSKVRHCKNTYYLIDTNERMNP